MKNREDDFSEKYDPIEDDPSIKEKVVIAKKEAEKILRAQGEKIRLGYCHKLWNLQKRILKEKYNIDWKTPAEMNPLVFYD